jgi:pentatricopeptide repeat protein
VLQDLVDSNKNDEAFDFWMRIKEDGVVVDVSAYEVMMQQCTQTYQVERAFNYLDEMRGSKIDPSVTIFEELFKCCGSAPHWVNGYQDTIFDAMALMEGAELLPSQKIYDNIIQSFGQAGDAASAEFYFWEMRQKGIQQGASTYKNLFGALARYYVLF